MAQNSRQSLMQAEIKVFVKMGKARLCNWCGQQQPFVEGEHFCYRCFSQCQQICIRCRRPFPCSDKYFKLHSLRCNSCQRKYLKEIAKRSLNK